MSNHLFAVLSFLDGQRRYWCKNISDLIHIEACVEWNVSCRSRSAENFSQSRRSHHAVFLHCTKLNLILTGNVFELIQNSILHILTKNNRTADRFKNNLITFYQQSTYYIYRRVMRRWRLPSWLV